MQFQNPLKDTLRAGRDSRYSWHQEPFRDRMRNHQGNYENQGLIRVTSPAKGVLRDKVEIINILDI